MVVVHPLSSGSFVVVDSESLEQLASFHHRKEEISDIKFSPSKNSSLSFPVVT